MKKQEKEQRIGAATYVIERVFSGMKTPREVVTEEIITTAGQTINPGRSGKGMV